MVESFGIGMMDSFLYVCSGCGNFFRPECAFKFVGDVYCSSCLTKIDRTPLFMRSIAFRRAGAFRTFDSKVPVNERFWDSYFTYCTYCFRARIGKREDKLCNRCIERLGNHLEHYEAIFLFADNLAEELLIDLILESYEEDNE